VGVMAKSPTLPISTIAKLLALDVDRLKALRANKTITAPPRKPEWPVSVITEYVEHLRATVDGDGDGDAHVQRTRLLRQQADKLEMENSLTRGETVRVADVVSRWAKILGATRTRLLSMPTTLATIVANENEVARCQSIIEGEVYDALSELSAYDGKDDGGRPSGAAADGSANDGDVETTAKIDRRAVGRQGAAA
tara:strand:+ start:608 stop:1192 length:585 start_codon:yes stop_codon:yes gene_type:complete